MLFLFSGSLSLLYCWRLCFSCFPPSRLWSSRLAFHSVTVSLVCSLLLLECSYSPQLFCGSSWVSASCLAPAFGGSLTRVYLFCFFGLYRFWPPSFPAPQVSYGLVVVSPGWSPPLWLFSFTRPTFVHCGLVLCCLSPVCLPHLGCGYVVSSVFISYAICLCRLCSWCLRDGVTLAWVECRCCFLPSIGTKATFLSVLSIPS